MNRLHGGVLTISVLCIILILLTYTFSDGNYYEVSNILFSKGTHKGSYVEETKDTETLHGSKYNNDNESQITKDSERKEKEVAPFRNISNTQIALGWIQKLNCTIQYKKTLSKLANSNYSQFLNSEEMNKVGGRSSKRLLRSLRPKLKHCLPDAVVIGGKKCGSSDTRNLLRAHTEIAVPRREAHYFDKPERLAKGLEYYISLMTPSFPEQITMDKTPDYWVTKSAPEDLLKMNPNVKLIVVLREPTCRLISEFFHDQRVKRIEKHLTVMDVLMNDSYKAFKDVLLKQSLYDVNIKPWLEYFPLERFYFFKTEDMKVANKLQGILTGLEHFLQIPHQYNVSLIAKTIHISTDPRLRDIIYQERPDTGCKYDTIYPEIMKKYKPLLKPHVEEFEKLIGKQFHWYD